MILDLNTYPSTKDCVLTLRAKLRELVDYMQKANRKPLTVHVFANDYNAAVRSVNAAQKRAAKAAANAEAQKLRAAGKKGAAAKVTPEPDLVEAVQFEGIRVEPIAYSRPRAVQA